MIAHIRYGRVFATRVVLHCFLFVDCPGNDRYATRGPHAQVLAASAKIAIGNCKHCCLHADVMMHGENELRAAELVQPIVQQVDVDVVSDVRR